MEPFLQLTIIFIVTLLVRMVTVMVGGGGIVLIPMLLFFGLLPSEVIATNRLGAQGTNLTLIKFHKNKLVKWKLGFYLLIPALLGVILGTLVVIKINQGLFENIIAILLILAIPLIFFNRNVGLNEKRGITQLRLIFGMFLSMLASFIGGLFALTGLWFNYVYLYLGLTFKQIAGTRKIIGSITGIISSIMLIVAGLINWPIAIVMFIASVLGGWLGATIGIRVDNIWIKNLFLLIAMASAIKILFF